MARLLTPATPVSVAASAAVGGYEERRGALPELFDFCAEDDLFGQDTFELAEAEMARMALGFAEGKLAGGGGIDLLFAGDLQNQCVAASQGPALEGTPFLGLFGACSTMVEGLGLGMLALSGASALSRVAAVTSSHNAAAERQFRTPLEYGGQRTPSAQWTATAAGAVILARDTRGALLDGFLPGRVVNAGISDAANMGAAMAPAAAETLSAFFRETGESPLDYDLILTGDLGKVGSRLLLELLSGSLPDLGKRHRDAGCLLYCEEQDAHAGASGCGCIASLLAGKVLGEVANGTLGRVLAVGTGALMNPGSLQQGGEIGGVAHLVRFVKGEG